MLGPLEVVDGARPVSLGGHRQRAVLALLLVHARQVVTVDRMVDELWSGEPPGASVTTLRGYIHHLRRALEPGRPPGGASGVLATQGPGYLARVAPEQLDRDRFERCVDEARTALEAGRAAEAAQGLHAGLGLWRGPALADFASEPFARPEIGRLEELRLAAAELRLEADLALGRHAELVGELEWLVEVHPLRERLWGQLMTALYRCGRQADALRAYRRVRAVLGEELGIEPVPALQRLERAVLLQEAWLDPPLPAPATARARHDGAASAPTRAERAAGGGDDGAAAHGEDDRTAAPSSPFVGRERELGALEGCLHRAAEGHGQVVVVSGAAGVGKTRAVEEFGRRAHETGARVVWGRCYEGAGAAAPYWPWVQALRAYASLVPPDELTATLGEQRGDVARVVGHLVGEQEARPAERDTGSLARFQLFDGLASVLTRAGATAPIVVVLDDVQWADEDSLLLLEFLSRSVGEARALLVVIYRDSDVDRRHPLIDTLGTLAREPSARRLALGGLGADEVARYVELATGATSPPLAAALHRRTDGNAFFVSEVVALLAAEGRLGEAPGTVDWSRTIPAAVRDVIHRRCRRLSPRADDALVHAAVLGREFRLDVLERFCELPAAELLPVIEELITSGLIVEDDVAIGVLRFSHDLVRETLYWELPAVRRVRMHRSAAVALEELLPSRLPPPVAEVAHHLWLAIPAGADREKAAAYSLLAAETATAALAYEDALAHYERALGALDDTEGERRCELLLALAAAQWRAGNSAAARDRCLAAAQMAQRLGAARLLAEAVVGVGGGVFRDWHCVRGKANEQLLGLLQDALDLVGRSDERLRARLLGQLAEQLYYSPQAERRLELSAEAVSLARRVGEPETLASALCSRCLAAWTPEHCAERLELATEIIALARQVANPELSLFGRHYLFVAQLELGLASAATATLEEFERQAEALRQPLYLWVARWLRALEALFVGRFGDAERLAGEALELGQRAEEPDALNIYAVQVGTVRMEQDRLDEIEPVIRAFVDQFPEAPSWRSALSFIAAATGKLDEARVHFEWLARNDFSALPRDFAWLTGLALLSQVCAAVEDERRAKVLHALFEPFADRNVMTGDRNSWGAASLYLGLLATTVEDYDRAERWFEQALESNTRMGATPWVAHTRHAYASMLLRRGRPTDEARAEALLAEARATAERLGMARLLRLATPAGAAASASGARG